MGLVVSLLATLSAFYVFMDVLAAGGSLRITLAFTGLAVFLSMLIANIVCMLKKLSGNK